MSILANGSLGIEEKIVVHHNNALEHNILNVDRIERLNCRRDDEVVVFISRKKKKISSHKTRTRSNVCLHKFVDDRKDDIL